MQNFNNEFDEIIRVNRTLSVPDSDVRGLVIGEIKRVVIPLYTRFYDKYPSRTISHPTSSFLWLSI